MHKKNVYLPILILTCILLTSFFSTASAQTLPPTEADCRVCHEMYAANYITHHTLVHSFIPAGTVAPYGTPWTYYECESCHATESSCGEVTYIVERDCMACHVVNTNMHHAPAPTSCAMCHEDTRPADPHPQSTDCAMCHSDPGGSWLFDHTPFPTSCTLCHEIDRPADPHPQISDCNECHLDAGNSWLGATYAHSPPPSTCNACHESERPADPHPQTRDCAECHLDAGNFWLGATYDHTPDPTSCALCHEVDRPANQHPQQQDCSFCHNDPGGSWQSGAECNSCHGNPPDNGNHIEHVDSIHHGTTYFGEINCETCHSSELHFNQNIDVNANLGFTQNSSAGIGTGMCGTACHTAAIWNGPSITCYDCHGSNCNDCHGNSASPEPQIAPTAVPESDIESAGAATITLEWDAVPPSAGYETEYYVVLSVNQDFRTPPSGIILDWAAGNSRTVTLDTSRHWYWIVKARDKARPGIVSSYSSTDDFSISIPGTPVAPVLSPEPDTATADLEGNPLPVTLEWLPVNFSDPVEYYVEVDGQSTMTTPDFTSGWISATNWTFDPPYFAPYWWRVKSRNASDPAKESAWSFVDEFRPWSPSGSCPFLYVWDGNKFVFQTDLYGPGKLGAKGSFGYFTPNPNDYYVLATQPVEKDGYYPMRLVEERFETDYLDELKLFTIDVPMNRSLYAEKPGFGGTLNTLEDVLHTTSQVLRNPVSVIRINSGENVSAKVSHSDGEYLVLNNDRNLDFTYQTLELDLGDLASAPQIKLVIDGVTAFPDTPEGTERSTLFGPRTKLEVLDTSGQWVKVDKAIAELPKPPELKRPFVLDITNIFQTDTYKVRLTFLFKTYIDSLKFDITRDQEISLTEVMLLSADLRSYGLSDEVQIFDDIFNYLYRADAPNF